MIPKSPAHTTGETRRVGVVVGHTLGHTLPALAFLRAYRERAPLEALVLGPASDAIRDRVLGDGFEFAALGATAWQLQPAWAQALAVVHAASAVLVARRLWRAARVSSVVGFGGYASGPGLLAARSLGLATAIHEANAQPGLANRRLAPIVDRVFVSQLTENWPADRTRRAVVGIPLRPGFEAHAGRPLEDERRGPMRLLVASGSRGASFFARVAPAIARCLCDAGVAVEVRQQAQPADAPALREAYARLGVAADVTQEVAMPEACVWADVALVRGGASTLAELAALGVPALVVPLGDAAEDHQSKNAAAVERAGAGVAIAERGFEPHQAAEAVLGWARDQERWRAARRAARGLARYDAGAAMVESLEALRRDR